MQGEAAALQREVRLGEDHGLAAVSLDDRAVSGGDPVDVLDERAHEDDVAAELRRKVLADEELLIRPAAWQPEVQHLETVVVRFQQIGEPLLVVDAVAGGERVPENEDAPATVGRGRILPRAPHPAAVGDDRVVGALVGHVGPEARHEPVTERLVVLERHAERPGARQIDHGHRSAAVAPGPPAPVATERKSGRRCAKTRSATQRLPFSE